MFLRLWLLCTLVVIGLVEQRALAAGSQSLKARHVPPAVAGLAPIRALERDKRIKLAIGLPLRDEAALDALLRELQNPVSPNYRQWLIPQEFAERFGPSVEDYNAVEAFAIAHGLTVTHRHPNRVVLDIEGTAREIEAAFNTHLSVYQHPSENREFYAPDTEPTLDLSVPIVDVSGLDNFNIPKPKHVKRELNQLVTPQAGSGPGGAYMGSDFRAAYVPGTTLTGAGQTVGLLQFDGFYASDISAYASQAGLVNPNIVVVPIDGGVNNPGSGNSEVALDIEMVMSMAPGIATIYVYEAPNPSPWVDLLSRMANDNLSKQLSCSWGGGGVDATAENIFKQMGAQGQSFYNASGDSDAFTSTVPFPSDSTNITQVGGTTLTTGAGATYSSETVWNWGLQQGSYVGSSGGVSTYYGLPVYQQGISMVANQGSTTKRNIPDVALTGDNVYVRYNNGSAAAFGGTSCAAPLWAGLTALINQQAAINGMNPVGFMNPPVYAIGKGANYANCFNDTTVGNNFSSSSPTKYSAVAGYDLCTGWGTPKGNALITALAGTPAPLVVAETFSLLTETCTNNAVDPNEAVTVLLGLKNIGSANTTNVVATLLATGGVTAPSGAQTFGLLPAGGSTVSKPFTFTAAGVCGSALTVTLQLQDGTQNLGTAQFNLHLGQVAPGITLTQNFDGNAAPALPVGWSTSVVAGTGTSWVTTNGSSFSAPNAAFGLDAATAGVNALVSPVVFIGSANPQITFRHNHNLEKSTRGHTTTYYDGGVLEIKVGNGAFADVIAAGGSFVTGNYNCTLTTSSDNPYEGRQAWGSTSGGWTNVTVNLPASAVGQNVQFRWALGTDSSNAGSPVGWFVDDVSVQGGIFVCCSSGTTNPPSITSQPTNQTAVVGSNTFFSVSASGTAPLSYQWQHVGTNLPSATSSTLSLFNVQTNHAGGYRVIITNSAGSVTSTVATLSLLFPPGIVTQPANITVLAGASASFVSAATGTSPLSYQWYFNTTNKVGTNGPALGFVNAQPANEGSYQLVVSNAAGMATSTVASLTVLVPPSFTQQPTNQSTAVGANVTLAVAATGTGPLSYQWQQGGTNLPGSTTNVLSLLNVQTNDAGAYRVVITNAAGSATSDVATLTVIVPPSIVTEPTNATVIAGAPASFVTEAAGTAPLAYQWYFNTTNALGTNGPAFGLASAEATNEGAYQLVVSNAAGAVTSSVATLIVLLPPEITLQPSNTTVIAGEALALHGLSSGSAPLQYQWYFNNSTLGTNSPDLIVGNTQPSNEGAYYFIVTNAAGATTSDVAAVTVLVPPSFTLEPSNTVVNAGENVLLVSAATGSAPLGYYWLFNATNVIDSGASLSLTNVQSAQAGAYQVIATNNAGAATSSIAILSILTQPILLSPMIDTNGAFTFLLSGDVGRNYLIEASTNLENWDAVGSVSNANGQTPYVETNADFWFRVYRARRIP